MSKLPIEGQPELLKAYGRAMAWINATEVYLNLFLRVKAGCASVDNKIVNQILDEIMIGKKINLAQHLLPDKLVNKLWKLNHNRLLLAHGITGEEVPADNPMVRKGKISIEHKRKKYPFTIEFLTETINLAKEISKKLHQEIIKKGI